MQKGLISVLCLLCLLSGNAENGSSSSLTKLPSPTSTISSGEIITWNGKTWNITNSRIFEARFERYLNTPEESETELRAYIAVLEKITHLLASGHNEKQRNEALALLTKASEFRGDAQLCEVIATQVQTTLLANRSTEKLVTEKSALEEERRRIELKKNAASDSSINAAARPELPSSLSTRSAEIDSLIRVNGLKQTCALIESKVGFQALIIQLFFQRRFLHVMIATHFYRSIFTDGENHLYIGAPAWNFFSNANGTPATIVTIEAMSNGIVYDVKEGLDSFAYLLDQGELESASRRLAEMFVIGEHLPDLHMLSCEKKRRILAFNQKTHQLSSAMEVKNYILAEKILNDLQSSARDFDTSKYKSQIETSKILADLQLAKSKNAFRLGDRTNMEKSLSQATEIWPLNPNLIEVQQSLLLQINAEERTLEDFSRLEHQQNYHQIYESRFRFIAATAHHSAEQKRLMTIVDNVEKIEATIIQSQKFADRGNDLAAWETLEKVRLQFPDDEKLMTLHNNLTPKVVDFVKSLRDAQSLENKSQSASSLALYFKIKKQYPASIFAEEGIHRLTKKLSLSAQ